MKRFIISLLVILSLTTTITNAKTRDNQHIVNTYTNTLGNNIVEFSDDSSLVYNLDTRVYKFYPAYMEDGDEIELHTINQVKEVVTNHFKYAQGVQDRIQLRVILLSQEI